MKQIKRYNIILILIFMSGIILPIILANKVGGGIAIQENRYLAKFPKLFNEEGEFITSGIRSGLEGWINDNVFGRELASKINTKIDFKIFKQNTTKNIMFGKDHWIYLMDESNIKRIQNNDVPTQEKIEAFKSKADSITQYFNKKDADFLITVFPHKVDVYSEYLSDTIMPVQDISFLDVYKDLSNETSFDLNINVEGLLKLKKERVIYSKAYDNAHWNNYGSFVGYTQIMEGIKEYIPGIKILEENDFEITPFEREVYIAGELYTTEIDYNFILKDDRKAMSDKDFLSRIGFVSKDPWQSYNYYKNSDKNLPKAIIVGDSYIWMFMLDNLAESFSELVFIHQLDVNSLDKINNVIHADMVVVSGLTGTVYSAINDYEVNTKDNQEDVKITNQQYQYLDFLNNQVLIGQNVVLDKNSPTTSLEGWAVDCIADTVASGVVIEINGKYYNADYGKERQSVVDYFSKKNWLNSGYTITLNTQEIIDAKGFKVHVISNDGSYKYEPVEYSVYEANK